MHQTTKQDTSFDNIVVHVGTNDARMRQTEVTKSNIARLCDFCGFGFIDNWPSLWGRPGVLMRDGLHPTGLGASILSKNIDRSLSQA